MRHAPQTFAARSMAMGRSEPLSSVPRELELTETPYDLRAKSFIKPNQDISIEHPEHALLLRVPEIDLDRAEQAA